MPHTNHEEKVISAVKKVMPAVVSIVVAKDYEKLKEERAQDLLKINPFDVYEQQPLPEAEELPHTEDGKIRIGGGSGFFVSKNGLILTNKHVIADHEAEYSIITASDDKYKAMVIARDPINDVAILKIEEDNLPTIELGDSNKIELGQSVLAIGTALGEFSNTVSLGIVSGLSRFITAVTDMEGHMERLGGLIQTDAAINPGNSGGPLVDLDGKVIGINSAVVFGAQNIGFAIPINKAERDLDDLLKFGKIRRPFLGIRYILVNDLLQKKFKLPVNCGALVMREGMPGRKAVIAGSPADKAGIKEADIILALDNTNISEKISVEDILEKISIGQEVPIRIMRDGEKFDFKIKLEERGVKI